MKIVEPTASMKTIFSIEEGVYALRKIEEAARISHRSEERMGDDTWRRFIESVVLHHGDWSVVEHASAAVEFYVDRGVTHELVRHRLFGFTQESTRFVNYAKKIKPSFIYPFKEERCKMCSAGSEAIHFQDGWFHTKAGSGQEKCTNNRAWMDAIYNAENSYLNLIEAGWAPQMARSVFPNALASKILVTGNLRNWRHFFLMRTTVETHPQMKEVTGPLLAKFQEFIPILFDDISLGSRQIENLKKGR